MESKKTARSAQPTPVDAGLAVAASVPIFRQYLARKSRSDRLPGDPMKIAAIAVAVMLTFGVHAAESKPGAQAVPSTEATTVIPVKGMSCGGCVAHVNEGLRKVVGVKSVTTDLEKAQTTVVYDAAKVKPDKLVAAIAETGYEPGKPVVR
jgi:copper chaperone